MNEGLVVLVRGIIAFFTLLIFTRILGKQQISQLTFFEYILGITCGSIASELTVDLSSRAWPHFVGLFTWFILTLIIQLLSLKFRKFSNYIEGEPIVVIMDGKILEKSMKKIRFRLIDLLELLRQNNVFDISEVHIAVVEINGKLSIIKKAEYQNPTLKDLKINATNQGLCTDLIYDGNILIENLEKSNLSKDWLFNELKKKNIKNPKEVFYATLNSKGNFYYDKYDDSNVKLKKIPANYENKVQKKKGKNK